MKHLLALASLLLVGLLARPALAFSQVPIGETLPQVRLRTLDGKTRPYLAKDRITLFVFFRPGQPFSRLGLQELVAVQARFEDRPVAWTALVSDYYAKREVRELLKETGLQATVLVDAGDRVYGQLGVAVHPSVGIADAGQVLRAYLPFRKINYGAIVEAHLLHALGELDDAGLRAVLDPPRLVAGGDTARARRQLKMGEMLFKLKKYAKVRETAEKSLEIDPGLAAAHGLIAATHAAEGHCPQAAKPLARALELDPEEPHALEARAACDPGAASPAPEAEGEEPAR